MNYGQIIFHLEDYYNYGGIVSTDTNRKIIQITAPSAPSINAETGEFVMTDDSINIYGNLVSNDKHWVKIGIQAPAGTKFELNDKPFVIGPSGLYELSNVNINTLKFIPLAKYELDSAATKQYLTDGKNIMQTALNLYSQQIKGLDLDDTNTPIYKTQTEKYITAYETGYNLYQVGLNGVYKPQGYQIQKNIIIDYREEKKNNNIEGVNE